MTSYTSFVTVACVSDKRWFDLDAVRTETRTPGGRARGPKTGGAAEDHRDTLGEFTADMAEAGAPPLDWHDDCDPPPPPKEHAVTTTTITVHRGDIRTVMQAMPDNSVDLLVTSPPFLALRSYLPADHPDKPFEIGSEATPAAFIDTLLDLSAEWRRIVSGSGSIAVEIGDTYSGASWGGGDLDPTSGEFHNAKKLSQAAAKGYNKGPGWPLAKSLCMIPELYGVALAYGINPITGLPSPAGRWRVRNWLTWTRPNPPVGALGDKFRPATSFVTVACTSDKRWFDLDAVRTEGSENTHARGPASNGYARINPWQNTGSRGDDGRHAYSTGNPAGAPPLDWHHDETDGRWFCTECGHEHTGAQLGYICIGCPCERRPDDDNDDDNDDDWQPLHRLPTAPYAGAHYATYPIALPTKLIEAMCPAFVCIQCGTALGLNHETRTMPGVRRDNNGHLDQQRKGPTADPVLLQDLRQSPHGTEQGDHPWICDDEGVQTPSCNGSPDGWAGWVRDGASSGNGGAHWPNADGGRGGTPPQRESVRQQDREFGTPPEIDSRSTPQVGAQTSRLPALRRVDPNATECPACSGELRPGRVFDPFAGSGTTLLAAALAGRDAVGVDLDSRNLDLIRHRIGEAVLIVSERHDGDTVTWTVNRHMPGTKGEADGQQSLFSEEAS